MLFTGIFSWGVPFDPEAKKIQSFESDENVNHSNKRIEQVLDRAEGASGS